jgi:hypothetical protein
MDAENINHTAAMTAKGACRKSEAIVLQAASGGCFIGAGAAGAFLVPTHPWRWTCRTIFELGKSHSLES